MSRPPERMSANGLASAPRPHAAWLGCRRDLPVRAGEARRRKPSRRRGGTQCPARLALALSPPVSLSESQVKDNEHMTGGGALSSALRRRPRSLRRAATGGSAAGDPRASRRMSGAAPWSRRSLRAAWPRLRSRGRRGRFDSANRARRVAGASGTTVGLGAENRETEDDSRPAIFPKPPIWEDGCAGRSAIDFAGWRIGRVAVRSGGPGRNMRSGVVVGQCGVRRGPAGTRRRSAAA